MQCLMISTNLLVLIDIWTLILKDEKYFFFIPILVKERDHLKFGSEDT